MTKAEILAMKPSPELDALVAEHVFGWRKVHGPKTDYDGPCESFDVLVPPTIDDPNPLYPPSGAIKPWYFCRHWSSGIAIAWEVLEKMNCPYVIASTEDGDQCWVHFGDEGNAAVGEAPEAICKAAILAKVHKS